ncbi:MAG: Gfo/Idh/MocA family oxidoreductase [Candidatus Omnitrophica bacterium]|nr:Gfo/Idh/MocA family oxidoreductase [Candidatus Omnitrophota bacterium]
MTTKNRRTFLRQSAWAAAGFSWAPAIMKTAFAMNSPNDAINIAVVGIGGRGGLYGGGGHYPSFAKIPNVKVTTLCDIDERLFPEAVSDIEETFGYKPKTEVDFRKVLEDKEIDAVSIATPDHWHALQAIWACQAGKDVYCEKPLSYTIDEGRKMVQAARKYNRVVQVGTQHVSAPIVREALQFLHEGNLGDIYMGRAIVYGGRGNIGRVKDSPIPDGVHWDLFLGPAPYRPFNQNRFHYNWHWFWDTSTTEFGNNGVHMMDLIRRGMNKRVHPVRVHCTGGYYVYDSDQEVPNIHTSTYEYSDGTMTEMEVRSHYTNPEGGSKSGAFFYGSKGWMHLSSGSCSVFLGPKDDPGPKITGANMQPTHPEVKGVHPHFTNFIHCVRNRNWHELHADVLEGHLSTTICHLGNISYRTGRKLTFNPYSEKFVNDEDADSYLTRIYREPYVAPDKV